MTKFVYLHLEETKAYTYRCLQGRERDRYNALDLKRDSGWLV